MSSKTDQAKTAEGLYSAESPVLQDVKSISVLTPEEIKDTESKTPPMTEEKSPATVKREAAEKSTEKEAANKPTMTPMDIHVELCQKMAEAVSIPPVMTAKEHLAKVATPLAADQPAMKVTEETRPQGESPEAKITTEGKMEDGKPHDIDRDIAPEAKLDNTDPSTATRQLSDATGKETDDLTMNRSQEMSDPQDLVQPERESLSKLAATWLAEVIASNPKEFAKLAAHAYGKAKKKKDKSKVMKKAEVYVLATLLKASGYPKKKMSPKALKKQKNYPDRKKKAEAYAIGVLSKAARGTPEHIAKAVKGPEETVDSAMKKLEGKPEKQKAVLTKLRKED